MACRTQMCGPCDRDKEKNEGLFWCETCSEGLCPNCLKEHKKNRASSNHKVIPVEDLTTEFKSFLSLNDLCDKHAGKIISLYCVGHDQLCCSVCLHCDHRQCADIVTVEDVATSATQSTALEDLQARVEDTRHIYNIILKEKNENIISLESQAGEHEKQLSKTKQLLMLQLSKAEISSVEDLEVKKKTCINNISEDTNYIRKTKSALEDLHRDLQFLKQSGSHKQVFINVKRLDIVQHNLEEELLKSRDKLLKKYELMLPSYSNSTSMPIGSMLEECKIKINIIEGVPELRKHQQCQALSSVDDGILQVTEVISPHGRFENMNVWKLCYFEEHDKVAITSTRKLIYVYDIQRKHLNEINIPETPWYIDKYDENHALVIGNRLLFKVNIIDSTVYKIETELKVQSFISEAVCVNGHIVIRDIWDKHFTILKNGQILRKIPLCVNDRGGFICGYGENKIIYSEFYTNIVWCITLEGQQVFNLTLPGNSVTGVAVDRNNFIYAGSLSGEIHKITPAGELVESMSSGEVILGMTYKKSTHELLVIGGGLRICKLPRDK